MSSEEKTFPASFDQVEAICDLVDRAAQAAGFDDQVNYACQLAVSEACENIICHGYRDEENGQIKVAVHSEPGEMTIELEDSAPPFDPTSVPLPDLACCRENQIGGLGLPIISRVMDEIEYSYRGSKNRLKLRKRSTSD